MDIGKSGERERERERRVGQRRRLKAVHASVPSIVGLAKRGCQTEGGGRGGGGGVQSVRGKERRARRRRETERRESECHWRCIQPAAKTVLRHLDPLSGRVARADRASFLSIRTSVGNPNSLREQRNARSIHDWSTSSCANARGKRFGNSVWTRGEECKKFTFEETML